MVSHSVSHGIAFGIVLFRSQMASGRQKIALVSQYRRYRIFLHVYKEKKHTERTTKNFPCKRLKIVRYLRYYDTFTNRCSYINTFLGIVLVSYWYRILESTIPSFARWRH